MKSFNLNLTIISSLFFVSINPAVGAELPDGKSIIEKVNELEEGSHVSRKIHMKMIDRRGKERERDTVSYRKYFGDDKKTIIFYLSPTNVKDTAFLTFDYKDNAVDDDQWLYLPALRKVRRISASDRGDYFLGTDFTYEDIKKEGKVSIEDYHYKTVSEEIFEGVDTYIVEAVTVNNEITKELGHSKAMMWVDKSAHLIRKTLYFDLNNNELKTLITRDVRKVDDIWTRHVLDVENHKTGHRTIFTFTDVDYTTNVNDRLFNKQSLRKGL